MIWTLIVVGLLGWTLFALPLAVAVGRAFRAGSHDLAEARPGGELAVPVAPAPSRAPGIRPAGDDAA